MDITKKLLIQLKPNNDKNQLAEMLDEFEAHDCKLESVISIPVNYTYEDEDKNLLIVLPDRIDFIIVLEPEEYLIIADN